MSVIIYPTTEIFFGFDAGNLDGLFILDDPVDGKLDTGGELADEGIAVDVSDYVDAMSIVRGRSNILDEFQVGGAWLTLENEDGRFLPASLDTDDNEVYGADAIVPGRRIRISVDSVVIFDGRIEDWDFGFPSTSESLAFIYAEDALGKLGRMEFGSWTTTASDLPGERIIDSLDRNEVSFGVNRDIDDGENQLQSDNVSYGSNVLNYLQLVSRSDFGRLFVSRTGVLTFRSRLGLIGSASTVTFGDAADAVPLTGVGVDYGSERLYNRVGIDRVGGTLQTVDVSGDDDTRSLTLTELLLSTDTQSREMAEFLANRYSQPAVRFESVRTDLAMIDDPSVLGDVLASDIADVVTVTIRPPGMSTDFSQLVSVEGVRWNWSTDDAFGVEFSLSPLLQESAFTLDDASFGVLDTDVLAF